MVDMDSHTLPESKLSYLERVKQLNSISRHTGYGEFTSAITNTYFGVNYRGGANTAALNTEQHGLTFFTRPCLNLSYDNISSYRLTTPLMTNEPISKHRAIRTLLDHRGAIEKNIDSPLIDDQSPFMAILTNNLISIGGWPDKELDTYSSKPGVLREVWSMVDSVPKLFGTYDFTANFRNIKGDPISLLFDMWTEYIGQVYIGNFEPYRDFIVQNRIDYQSRIYRLTMDASRQFVEKIGAAAVAVPTASPAGAPFNFTEAQPFTREADQISIRFKANVIEYNDPILVYEFNRVVAMFNPTMGDTYRNRLYRKLTLEERQYFNFRGYPRIDPNTMEFEVWISKELYNYELSGGV